jgi:hypothetical protein
MTISGLYPSQLAMWRLEQEQPGRKDCLVAALVRLTGDVDVHALDAALTAVIARHEALRTGFTDREGQPGSFVVPPPPGALVVVDLRGRDVPRGETEQLAREHSATPFDLTAPPLVRAALVRRSDREAVLSLAMHHLVTDGWSTAVVVRELAELYSARVLGRTPVIAGPARPYAEFAAERAVWFTTPEAAAQLSAWLRDLRGHRPLPVPVAGDAGTSAEPGEAVVTWFDEELSGRVRRAARAARATPFVFLLATAYVLLAGLTGETDLTVASAMANRTRRADEHVVGFLTNLVLLRARVTPSLPFPELLATAGELVLTAYERQAVPIEHVTERLAAENPAAEVKPSVLFCADNAAGVGWEFAGLTTEPIDREWIVPKRPLSLFLQEKDGRLGVRLVYRTDVLGRATALALGAAYRTLTERAIDRPAATVGRLLDGVPLVPISPHRTFAPRPAHPARP